MARAVQSRSYSQPCLGVVVPLWNEIETLPELHRRLVTALLEIDCSWRILYIDDGSEDETPVFVRSLQESDHRIQLIRLSRNFGQPAAIAAGLAEFEGDCAVVMDGDLQDPPELIPPLFDRWNAGSNVVIAQAVASRTWSARLRAASIPYRVSVLGRRGYPTQYGHFLFVGSRRRGSDQRDARGAAGFFQGFERGRDLLKARSNTIGLIEPPERTSKTRDDCFDTPPMPSLAIRSSRFE